MFTTMNKREKEQINTHADRQTDRQSAFCPDNRFERKKNERNSRNHRTATYHFLVYITMIENQKENRRKHLSQILTSQYWRSSWIINLLEFTEREYRRLICFGFFSRISNEWTNILKNSSSSSSRNLHPHQWPWLIQWRSWMSNRTCWM